MAKMTLLEIVQDILNEMDGDEVNSINDTIESQQIAQIVKTTYQEITSNRNWANQSKLIQLDASGDLSKPNYLKIPDDVKEVLFIKYDKITTTNPRILMQELRWKEPDSFLRLVSSRTSTDTHVQQVIDFNGTKLLITNNLPPTYWTSFDDEYVITDSYDVGVEATLQKNKTQCMAYVEKSWTHSDEFVPGLPSEAFSALLEESKSTAFFTLKQMANQKAEQKATRQQRWLSRKNWKANGGIQYENYGRKARK